MSSRKATSRPTSRVSPARDEPDGGRELRGRGAGGRNRSPSPGPNPRGRPRPRSGPRRPAGPRRSDLTEGGGPRYPGRPRGRRGRNGPRAQGGLAGARLGRPVRPRPGPRRLLAVCRSGGRVHLAPRLQPFLRRARPCGAPRRVGGHPHPSRDPRAFAGLAAPCVPRASHPSAPRLLHDVRDAGPAAVLGPAGELVDHLRHRPPVHRSAHHRGGGRAGTEARSRSWPRAPAEPRGPRGRRRMARGHGRGQGPRRPGGRSLPPRRRRRPLVRHAFALQLGAMAGGRDDRRRALPRRLVFPSG